MAKLDANSVALMERSAVSQSGSSSTIRLFTDTNGNSWRLSYIPVDASDVAELRMQSEAGLIDLEELPLPEEDFRAAEMAYVCEHQAELAAHYPGEWIAIDGPELIAHATSLSDLLQQAGARGHPNPFVTAVPAGPVIPFYG